MVWAMKSKLYIDNGEFIKIMILAKWTYQI